MFLDGSWYFWCLCRFCASSGCFLWCLPMLWCISHATIMMNTLRFTEVSDPLSAERIVFYRYLQCFIVLFIIFKVKKVPPQRFTLIFFEVTMGFKRCHSRFPGAGVSALGALSIRSAPQALSFAASAPSAAPWLRGFLCEARGGSLGAGGAAIQFGR